MVIFKKDKDMFDKFKLKSNPFRMVPAINPEELVWAGFSNIKSKIEGRIKRAINIPNSSLVLNWGEYGSGKTHAARYFSQDKVIQTISSDNKCLSFVVNCPQSKYPIYELYKQIVDIMDISAIRKQIEDRGVDLTKGISGVTNNVFLQNLLDVFFDSTKTEADIKSYLYGGSPKDSRLQRKIDESDYAMFFAALFSLVTFEKKAYSCVMLWVDEFESISLMNSSNISNINTFIRTLIDYAPNNLLMFLNLTQSAMVDVSDLSEYLHEAVKSRIKDKIEFELPDATSLKNYLSELLNDSVYRDSPKDDNVYFPFEEAVIDEVMKDLGSASLRRYNEAFSLLIENAFYDGETTITLDYYDRNKQEILGAFI